MTRTLALGIGLAILAGAGPVAEAQLPVREAPPRDSTRPLVRSEREVERLLASRRGLIGITISVEPEDSDTIGALVDAVTPGGPGARAGIRTGDVITTVNGRSLVATARELRRPSPGLVLVEMVASLSAGDTVRLQFRRGRGTSRVSVVLEPMPQFIARAPFEMHVEGRMMPLINDPEMFVRSGEPGMEFVGPNSPGGMIMYFRTRMADLELAPMNPGLAPYFGIARGVLVINAPKDTRLSLQPGDVVLAVDGRVVTNPDQLFRALLSYGNGEQFQLEIMRQKRRETVSARVPEPAPR